jgi:IPT/TIG domain
MPDLSAPTRPTPHGEDRMRSWLQFSLRAAALLAAIVLAGLAAQAAAAAPAQAFSSEEPRALRTLPDKFVELSTTGSVADVMEVSCESALAGSPVTLAANELRSRCHDHLSWVSPYPYESTSEPTMTLHLDVNATATVAVLGETCAAGESLVSAHLDGEPFYTASASFDVLAPAEAEGAGEGTVQVTPEAEVPNFAQKSIAVVASVAFAPLYSSEHVKISTNELYSDCGGNLVWVGPGASVVGTGTPSTEVQLDYDGRAFVVALAGECGTSEDLFAAHLEASPYTTTTADFVVEEQPPSSPGPRVTEVTPDEGPQSGGSMVTISGSHLGGATRVLFGKAEATSFKVAGESQVEAVVPPGSGDVDVTVTTSVGTSQRGEADIYRYLAAPAPTVTRVRRKRGPKAGGTEVTVTGEGFVHEATTVSFGDAVASNVIVHSPESLTATSPAGNGRVDVTVTTANGTSAINHADRFKYG